jgi:hypothetical protein
VCTDTKEGCNGCEDLFIGDHSDLLAALVREATTVICRGSGILIGAELQLAEVENASHDLANLGNLTPRELELSQGGLEELEPLCIINANLELRGVSQVPPALLLGSDGFSAIRS